MGRRWGEGGASDWRVPGDGVPEAKTVEVLHLESGAYRLVGRWHPGERARSRLLKGFEVAVSPLLGEGRGREVRAGGSVVVAL